MNQAIASQIRTRKVYKSNSFRSWVNTLTNRKVHAAHEAAEGRTTNHLRFIRNQDLATVYTKYMTPRQYNRFEGTVEVIWVKKALV
jgi:hypothetical protein